ncbi:bifunctional phosphopantothenoylcysteine decarboxylase/phosphopantothenate synthase [Novosphingobium sp. M1R2S20]|uniref:Coenzyme A biosynthesis bifunctional protein CoaBC n=1 Tax=Novosphingobium rhizovicinum TaxID=3228928 RepID=A0ABV3RDG6_9SPHN
MSGPRILLVVGGGIAAYKSCELVRMIRKEGGSVTCVLTEGGSHFVTPMALAALSENPVFTTLWDLKNETEMGHIQLSRQADLIVVCPATADLMAKMAAGIADDLATTLLLATDKPVMAVPAMNVRMWQHPATMRNVRTLRDSGVDVLDPEEGPMACGEYGPGRLPEPVAVWHRIASALDLNPNAMAAPRYGEPIPMPLSTSGSKVAGGIGAGASQPGKDAWLQRQDEAPNAAPADPALLNASGALPHQNVPDDGRSQRLVGRHVLVTAGPTHEPIDPVRYIANRSSGKQGFAIAAAAARAGARVTLVAGPVNLPTPRGVDRIDVESAREMAAAVKGALPADVAIMVAAVADWRTSTVAEEKMKKRGSAPPALLLTENPDILASVAASAQRPPLLVGFAAETQDVILHAQEKRLRKQVDWIVANDVSGDVMGGDANAVHIIRADDVVSLPEMPKEDVARILVERIADALA